MIKRKTILQLLPLLLLLIIVLPITVLVSKSDLSVYFQPAGRAILEGNSPYTMPEIAPFIYWPFSLWVFPVLTILPMAQYIVLIANISLLLRVIYRLRASLWWCLYPYGLYALFAGQLDLLVTWLAVEAYLSRKQNTSAIPVAIAIAIKPQMALFWLLPWLWGIPTIKQRIQAIVTTAVILLLPMLLWWFIAPDTVMNRWTEWMVSVRNYAGVYVGDSPSLWAIGLPWAGAIALIFWLFYSRDPQISRPLLALGLPAMRYYSTIALINAAPVWIAVPVAYVSLVLILITHSPIIWLDPAVMLIYHLWRAFQKDHSNEGIVHSS